MDALSRFREVWLCDTEFRAPDGERPETHCMVAREWRSGRTVRLWADQLATMLQPPFPIGADVLFVAYYASAELGCFLTLGWPLPARILDLSAEFRCITSGLPVPCGRSLLGAMTYFGLDGIDALEKEEMRQLAMRGGPYTPAERRGLLDYCESDVIALDKLLPAMLPRIDVPRALIRGRYMVAVARMEACGVPVDVPTLTTLRQSWSAIQDRLIARIDAGRGIYEGRTFKTDRFAAWLTARGIPWPRLESGRLNLSDDTFREMSRAYPDLIAPIGGLRHALSQLRLETLAVGSDGRNRCLLSPFASRTSRNQPSNVKYIFGPAVWLRSLIKPAEGQALAYIDFEQQEFGIAASLSGDLAMQAAYRSGDPYLTFAKQAGAVPHDATKSSHSTQREQFKTLALGVQYGMHAESLARRLNQLPCVGKRLIHSPCVGRRLIGLHRQTYPCYWQWSDRAEMTAMLSGKLKSAFGWTVHVGMDANPRSLRNFPLQANGAEMLRLACILATERGIRVCAPVHDALLIEAPVDEIEVAVSQTQECMSKASELVLPGFPLRTDSKTFSWPDRYCDPRGRKMWQAVWELLGDVDNVPTPIADDTPRRQDRAIAGDSTPVLTGLSRTIVPPFDGAIAGDSTPLSPAIAPPLSPAIAPSHSY